MTTGSFRKSVLLNVDPVSRPLAWPVRDPLGVVGLGCRRRGLLWRVAIGRIFGGYGQVLPHRSSTMALSGLIAARRVRAAGGVAEWRKPCRAGPAATARRVGRTANESTTHGTSGGRPEMTVEQIQRPLGGGLAGIDPGRQGGSGPSKVQGPSRYPSVRASRSRRAAGSASCSAPNPSTTVLSVATAACAVGTRP